MHATRENQDGELPTSVSVDGLGTFFICFSVFWTLVLIGGMLFLHLNRRMPMLRIRGLSLSFGAVVLLHMYWIAVQLGYIYGPLMAPGVEFWIMGIWLPFGIALFHASNSRFLYVAEMQKRFIGDDMTSNRRPSSKKKSLIQKWRSLDYTTKMLALVCSGMGFQLFLTLFMFVVSRKFHDSFGIPGTEVHGTPAEKKAAASIGWEWWPSVFWQCFWAWIVAPIILWRARSLHDTLGWRVQTIGCCLAGLHATPMWLIGLYVPAMAPVNKYWIPPQWIAVSIMLLEIFTIFLPCWEVIKHQSLRQETLESIARWEGRNKGNPDGSISTDHSSSYVSWKKPRRKQGTSISSSSNNSVLTMDALEHTLIQNPGPLQMFSALKDFSGENIAFLRRIAEWRLKFYDVKGIDRKMSVMSEKNVPSSPTHQVDIRASFEEALRIYIDFVSSRGAEFQVNLSSTDFKKLAGIFEHAARIVYGDVQSPDPATPFETPGWRADDKSNSSQIAINTPDAVVSETSPVASVRYWGEIPEEFNGDVFDDAEMSIKYLVLTNTWPKYVKARRSMDSVESLEASSTSA